MNVKTPWEGTIEPFRIWGNLYFVGTLPASVHVLDTKDGLLLFDCGYQESLYIVLDNMKKVGLDPENIKAIFLTHGHIDHCGAAAALRQRYGCRLYLGAEDLMYVNGDTELSFAPEMGLPFISFEPDVLLYDGDEFTFGDTHIRSIATPGHTKGCTSFIFNASDGKREVRVGLSGGVGLNTLGVKYLQKYGLPLDMRDIFISSLLRVADEPVELFLGNHADQNRTLEKSERLRLGELEAFIDKTEWRSNSLRCAEACRQLIASGK